MDAFNYKAEEKMTWLEIILGGASAVIIVAAIIHVIISDDGYT